MKLEWSALVNPGPFRQTASILTNDPRQPRLELSVEGEVTEATGLYPPDFTFDKITAGDAKSADVYVMAMAQDDLKVTNPELSNTETRQFFDVKVEPIDPKSLPNPQGESGRPRTAHLEARVAIGAVRSMAGRVDQHSRRRADQDSGRGPRGRQHQHLRPDVERRPGRVAAGPREKFRRRESAADGGDSRRRCGNVKLSVASVDPPELRAKLGEPKKVKDSLVHVPLEIEIPPGTPPMARLDIDQHDEARVVLKTNQPGIPEMVLGVRFAVER